MKQFYSMSIRKQLILGALMVLIVGSPRTLLAQTVTPKLWDKSFGGNNEDRLEALLPTSDGGFILGGSSGSENNMDKSELSKGGYDYWIVKLDSNANKVWDKTLGGNRDDWFSCMQQTTDGGYIIGGRSTSGISGDKTDSTRVELGVYEDFWVIKIDSLGNKQWDKTFGGTKNDWLLSLVQTPDDGFLIGGWSGTDISPDKSQNSKGGVDYWVLRLDKNGAKLWDKTIGGDGGDYLSSIQNTSDGGFILAGASDSNISGDKTEASKGKLDYWVVKLDVAGNKIWDKTFGGTEDDGMLGTGDVRILQTPDNGFILGASSLSGKSGDKTENSLGIYDYWVLKLDSRGNKLWDKTLGANASEFLSCIYQTSDGGFLLGGSTQAGASSHKSETTRGNYDYWLVKIDSVGNKLWDKSIGAGAKDFLSSTLQTSDGGYLLAGTSEESAIGGDKSNPGKGNSDYWLVKLGPAGTVISNNQPKLNPIIGPNPSKGSFNFQLADLTVPSVNITVTNLLGRVVLEQNLEVVNNQVSQKLDLAVSSGIYLLQVTAGNQKASSKIFKL